MPTLPTQSFQTIVSNISAGIQGRAASLLNFSEGSSLRAIAEGFSGLFLWFQAMVLQLLAAMRLSTASGSDVDTFTADFMPIIPGSQTATLPGGSPRLGSQFAIGQATFSRFTAAPSNPIIPVGAIISTQLGRNGQQYQVTADPSYATYTASPSPGGYVLQSELTSVIVPIQALQSGAAGNAQANTITILQTSIPGVDTVTNVTPLTTGSDQESDSALKKRFSDYILGLSRGDIYGLTAAIEGAEITIQWKLTEGYNLDGSYRPGFFFVVADDGSGTPNQAFLEAITNAADTVRPLSIQFAVFPPTVIEATPSLQITTAPGYDHATAVAQVSETITNNINALGLGNSLYYTQIAAWAYTVPGVVSVTAVLLNGVVGDSASLLTTKPTQDGLATINYATIKCLSCIVS